MEGVRSAFYLIWDYSGILRGYWQGCCHVGTSEGKVMALKNALKGEPLFVLEDEFWCGVDYP